MIRGTGSEDRRFRDAIRTTRPNSRYKKARPRDETRSCVLCGPTGAVTAEYQCDSSCLDGFAHVDHDGDLEHERLLNRLEGAWLRSKLLQVCEPGLLVPFPSLVGAASWSPSRSASRHPVA